MNKIKHERLKKLLSYLNHDQFITTTDACQRLGISEATARRDFLELEKDGMVRRSYGGIHAVLPGANRPLPFLIRKEWNIAEKKALARRTGKLLPRDASVIVVGGSSVEYLNEEFNSGTVVTDFPELALRILARFPEGDGPCIILTGGLLRSGEASLLGGIPGEIIKRFSCDYGIFSAYGADTEGMSEISEEWMTHLRVMMSRAKRKIAVMDHSKFHCRGMYRAFDWREIDTLVTSAGEGNEKILAAAAEQGVKVILCD